MGCPDDNELSELIAGALPDAEVERIEAHVDGCARCRGMLVELAQLLEPEGDAVEDAPPVDPPQWPGEGYLEGRYVPEKILGAGGMSLVYEGRDVVLQRRVALKVMLDAPEDVRARLRREARALAMLSHPNVVDVYDVDLSRGNAFLACELVEGGSLRQWLVDAPRDWGAIIDVIIDAARGLEAAHAVGLVHRDVTPGNVLVGEDGRGRVADFGLARLPESLGEPTVPDSGEHRRDGPRRTTGWVGTPGYVAPEVAVGRDAGAAADQYSLCVTAFEALHGHLPDESPAEGAAVRFVPRAVSRVLARGMRRDPADRFTSVSALRRALQNTRRGAAPVGWSVAALATFGLVVLAWPTRDAEGPCDRPPPKLAAAAPSIDAAVAREVERYADAWVAARQQTCDAEPSTAALDLRWACLHQRQRDFEALLRHVDDAGIEDSLVALERLNAPASCNDDDALARTFTLPPPEQATAVDRLQAELAEARAASQLDFDVAALAQLQTITADAERLGYDPLTADALLARGSVEREVGSTDLARRSLADAAHLATGAGLDHLAARAWLQLLFVEGFDAMDREATLKLVPVIDASLERAGDPEDLVVERARVLFAIFNRFGDHDAAEPHFQTMQRLAHTIRRDSLEYEQLLVRWAAHDMGRRDLDAAREHFEEARQIARDKLGPGTAREAELLTNLAVVELHALDFTVAVERASEALMIYEDLLPALDERVAWVNGTLGTALVFDDRPEDALPHLRRAREQRRATLDPGHPVAIDADYQLALALGELHRYDEAAEILAPAVAQLDGPDVPVHVRAAVLLESGRLWARRGHFELAVQDCERSREWATQLDGPTSGRAAEACIAAAKDNRVEAIFGT